jgi:CAAX prenyl protease-like protein
MSTPQGASDLLPQRGPNLAKGWLGRYPAVTFVLPFIVYMVVTSGIEGRIKYPEAAPQAPAGAKADPSAEAPDPAPESKQPTKKKKLTPEEEEAEAAKIPYAYYPKIYTIKIVLTLLAMLVVLPGYLAFPLRVSGMAVVVGVVGAVLWVAICTLHLEPKILGPLGLGGLIDMGRRPGFNPLKELAADPTWAYSFLGIRFLGLCFVVPIIEEFFLRGFLMRYVMNVDWPQIPFGTVDKLALAVGVGVPMLMHPGELFAAAVWFSMVTWLMLRTRNIWDCVVAHALTNLLMGLWVLWSGDWWLM